MQVDVREQRANASPLHRAHLATDSFSLFEHSGFQPFLDEPKNSLVCDSMLEKLYEPTVVEGIEKPTQVRIQHPAHFSLSYSD